MRIALDGMGGDRGPAVAVEGAVQALSQLKDELELILVGSPEALEPELSRLNCTDSRIRIHPAADVARMSDAPSAVLRQGRDTSIRVCFDLHKAGEAEAVVSAGNSGATMAVGMFVMGRLPQVERPALATTLPGLAGPVILLDVGANVDCTPLMLLQFGYMGAVYAERVLNVSYPGVGLLSIGEEEAKGNIVVKQAWDYFKNSPLNFKGNVEGRDMFSGQVTVVVCDGFVGNVCLKLTEGLSKSVEQLFHEQIASSLRGRMGSLLLKSALKNVTGRIDYENYGGAPLLGINGVTFVCHGASTPRAIASAVRLAAESIKNKVPEHLEAGLTRYRGYLLGETDLPGDKIRALPDPGNQE